jgi:hypothetical protein
LTEFPPWLGIAVNLPVGDHGAPSGQVNNVKCYKGGIEMDINLLGGDGEIGGNKVVVMHNNKRILLDFGMSFSRVGTYF